MTMTFSTPRFFSIPTENSQKVYHKRKLVIFGEFVPPFLKWFTPITGGYEAGNFPAQFELERRTPVRAK